MTTHATSGVPRSGDEARSYEKEARSDEKARPPIKMVGGKTKLLPELLVRVPERFEAYHEPFAGGAALFWALADAGRLERGRASLSDMNELLVRVYRALKEDARSVVSLLRDMPVTEEHYYGVRSRSAVDLRAYSDAEAAAWYVFVNKTTYNGIWRVNRKGTFNAPWGRWKKPPNTCDEPNLLACGEVLRALDVAVEVRPFEAVLEYARPGDLVYADPPYLPSSKTADFVGYTAEGFTYADQVRLRDVARELKKRGVHVLLSNSDVPLVRELYETGGDFVVDVVLASRSINSKPDGRGAVRELIVR